MKDHAFILHLEMIYKIIIKSKDTRIILLHNDYTTKQQKTIDSVCRGTTQIIGQITHSDAEKTVDEISRLIRANHEPFTAKDQIRYVIVGQSSQKNSEAEQLHV